MESKKSSKTKEMTINERWRIIGYIEGTFNFMAASAKYGFSRTGIMSLWSKFIKTNDVADLPRSGRPAKKNEEEKKQISQTLQKQYESTRKIGNEMSHSSIERYAPIVEKVLIILFFSSFF